MLITSDQATTYMHAMTGLTIRATTLEMRAAAYVLAVQTRYNYPGAAFLHLEPSDQGDWLIPTTWSTTDGFHAEAELEDDDASSHLYLPHIADHPDGGAVPGLWRDDRGAHRYTLDLDRIVSEYAIPSVAEVLTVRDPDGPTDVTMTVLGTTPPPETIAETSVDAGAGYEWSDWAAFRDEALAAASEALRPALLAAFECPPGGQYIEGRPEGTGWLDALSPEGQTWCTWCTGPMTPGEDGVWITCPNGRDVCIDCCRCCSSTHSVDDDVTAH